MDIIEQLEQAKAETLQYFDLPEQDLLKNYGPGKWSIRYVLHHLADSENIFLYRIRRVLSEPKQVIWAANSDAWAKTLDYSSVPLELARGVYVASRDAVVYLARRHYGKSHEIQFVHSEAGLRTLKDEFDKVALHNRQHIGHMEKALQAE